MPDSDRSIEDPSLDILGTERTAAAPEVPYEQAPTLIGGGGASDQDSVRVWAPDNEQLALEVKTNSLLLGLNLAVTTCLNTALGLFWGSAGPEGISSGVGQEAFPAWSAWRRPRLIATDSAGIAITLRRGTRALKWSDLQSLWRSEDYQLVLKYLPKEVELNLYGYQDKARRDLCSLIVSRAGLEPLAENPLRFVRP